MSEPVELLPCPFCGNKAQLVQEHRASFVYQCEMAGCCDAGPRGMTESDARAAWNSRVPPPEDEMQSAPTK